RLGHVSGTMIHQAFSEALALTLVELAESNEYDFSGRPNFCIPEINLKYPAKPIPENSSASLELVLTNVRKKDGNVGLDIFLGGAVSGTAKCVVVTDQLLKQLAQSDPIKTSGRQSTQVLDLLSPIYKSDQILAADISNLANDIVKVKLNLPLNDSALKNRSFASASSIQAAITEALLLTQAVKINAGQFVLPNDVTPSIEWFHANFSKILLKDLRYSAGFIRAGSEITLGVKVSKFKGRSTFGWVTFDIHGDIEGKATCLLDLRES
ncbi:MAG: hypothetical protein KDD56_07570, partial [Bdellovibrionales bacterium]|nr:hypothetical protein [Bdellovibrionales bacterium]